MAKIIQIKEDIIKIGLDDGTLTEVRKCDVPFEATLGDEVQIFQNETETIISKVEKAVPVDAAASGININLSNSNNSANPEYIATGKKAVNKLVYCLLAFFLGGLGAHKFYGGNIGLGIVYVLFCWTCIPAIIAFIEFLVALCKPADVNGNILV